MNRYFLPLVSAGWLAAVVSVLTWGCEADTAVPHLSPLEHDHGWPRPEDAGPGCYAPILDAGIFWTSAEDHWNACGLEDDDAG